MELIEPTSDSTIGWTPDRFSGYLAIDNDIIWIKVIQSKHKNKGYFRTFVRKLHSLGYTVKIVDAMVNMEKICIHYGSIPSVEEFHGKECIIWTLKVGSV